MWFFKICNKADLWVIQNPKGVLIHLENEKIGSLFPEKEPVIIIL